MAQTKANPYMTPHSHLRQIYGTMVSRLHVCQRFCEGEQDWNHQDFYTMADHVAGQLIVLLTLHSHRQFEKSPVRVFKPSEMADEQSGSQAAWLETIVSAFDHYISVATSAKGGAPHGTEHLTVADQVLADIQAFLAHFAPEESEGEE